MVTTTPIRETSPMSSRNIDMLHGPLLGRIILFAIPLALSSILQQLFNSADAIVAGRFIGSSALAAVGGTMPVISLLIGLFLGLSVGTNVAVAVRIGQGDLVHVSGVVRTTAVVTLVSSVVLTVVGLATTQPIIDAIGMPADARLEADQYLRIYFGGIVFYLVYNFGAAVMRARGDSRRPLYALAVAVALNVVLNLFTVQVLGWGVVGIALATDLSNAVAAGIVVWFLVHEEGPCRLELRHLRPERSSLAMILHIGIPAGLQSVVFSLSNVLIQAAINGFGTAATAGSSAAMNFEYYTYFFVSAFASTAVTFIGQNYAAGDRGRCDTIFRYCMILSLVSSTVLCVLFVGLGKVALGLFTSEAVALSFASVRMWHVELLEMLPSAYEITAGAMRGMGWSVLPTVITVFGSCVLRIVFVFLLFPRFGSFEALMDIYPISWVITGGAMIALYILVRRRAFARLEPAPAAEG